MDHSSYEDIIVVQDSPKSDDHQEIICEEHNTPTSSYKKKLRGEANHRSYLQRTPEPNANLIQRSSLESPYKEFKQEDQKSKSLLKQQAREFDVPVKMNEKLINQLQCEEQSQQQRFQIDQFITRFSKDQNAAIQYLLDNGLCDNTYDDIAKFIYKTDGLNKDAVNKFFGSTKERNQLIFEAYCRQLNILGVPFLQSLRILLKRFRLSGEAQQVDRMVKIFAQVYHQQNPNVFENDETPYILAYSFIMLSTDSASVKIKAKDKMTKEEFVKNNVPVFKTIPRSYFEEIYDQITKEPFQTCVDYIEQMYNRMILCNDSLQGDSIIKALQQAFDLMKGSNIVKYGRIGDPKTRKVFLSADEKRICWKSIDNENEPARYINVSDVYDLALGYNTTEVFKKNKVSEEFDMFCFSIITTQRTVDLKVNDLEMKSKWVNYLRAVILTRRENEAKRAQLNLKRQENEVQREEIWRNDILPYWQDHWDYKRNKPENFKKYISVKKEEAIQKAQNTANAGSILVSICSCLKKTILLKPITAKQQIQQAHHNNQQSDINPGGGVQVNRKNKSLLLMILWKLGIPDFVRNTIWPIVIGNSLQLTPSLYQIQLQKLHNNQILDKSLEQSFKLIQQELHQDFYFLDQNKIQQLSHILHAFVYYRPDFGYISGMSLLASMLVHHLNEYDSFQAFSNLIHQYHFLPIFIGDMRQIEWKIRFFDDNLQRILPLVYAHLKAINASSRIYLIKWFVTLFYTQFPINMLSRLWDNFILEGEIYLFKVAISYMKYFQLELKMSTLDGVNRILSEQQTAINEDYFFIQTDEIPLKEDEYQNFIQQQQAALLNTQIHQILLVS